MKFIETVTLLALFQIYFALMTCDSEGPGYWKFVSKTVASLKVGVPVEIQGKCFQRIVITLAQKEGKLVGEVLAEGHKGELCVEFLILTSGNTSKPAFIFLPAKLTLEFELEHMSPAEREYVAERGLWVLRSCDNLLRLPQNVFMTLKLFLGGLGLNPHIPIFGSKVMDYQLKANIDWTEKVTGLSWQLRKDPRTIQIDKNSIKSGDYLSVIRFDGLDNLIHVTTGSRSGHSTLALWRDGELYVLESQDAWYWPKKGIQMNKWEDWIQWAENADYNVALIPLKEELRGKFDADKVWQEFKKLEGLSYGFANFFFGYVDTPNENLPDWIDTMFASLVIGSVLEKILPGRMSLMVYEALNMRLGTKGLNMRGIWEEVYKRKTTMAELWAQVEQEGWQYSTGENLVCSAFLIRMYKAAGLFGDLQVNSPEFTPKDLYELNFFDVSGAQVPRECEDSAPHGYCQLTGKVEMNLGRAAWVEPYSHMAEKCPTIGPDFNRRDNC